MSRAFTASHSAWSRAATSALFFFANRFSMYFDVMKSFLVCLEEGHDGGRSANMELKPTSFGEKGGGGDLHVTRRVWFHHIFSVQTDLHDFVEARVPHVLGQLRRTHTDEIRSESFSCPTGSVESQMSHRP